MKNWPKSDRRGATGWPIRASIAWLGLGLMLWPTLAMAQAGSGEPRPTNRQLEDAYAACGGPPIQNNLWVQPTPGRIRCLERHLGLKAGEMNPGEQRAAAPPQGEPSGDGMPGTPGGNR